MKKLLSVLIVISLFCFTLTCRATETSKLVTGPSFNSALYSYSVATELSLTQSKVPYIIFGRYDDYKDNLDTNWDDTTNVSVSQDDTTKLIKGTYNDEDAIYVLTNKDTIVFNEDSSTMFYLSLLNKTKEILFNNIDTSNVTNMSEMFHGLTNLVSLDLSGFDTSNVTNMHWMFNGCNSLTELDLSNFNTSKVTRMEYMFDAMYNLNSLDISSFDTSKVENFQGMFSNCKSLTSLDLSSFNTTSAVDSETNSSMWGMFSGCESLTSLDISSFDTSNVINMASMFNGCESLTSLDISNFNTSKVENMNSMFDGCKSLTSLDLHNFDTSNVLYTKWMFQNNTKLKSIYVSENGFKTTNITTANSLNMFKDATSLVGGKGTVYDSSKTNKEYAIIDDAPEHPGYFTLYVPRRVSFVPNNGTTIDDVIVPDGDVVELPNVTKEEYVLGYWSEDIEFESIFGNDTPVTKDLTLYARWYLQYDWNDDKDFGVEDIVLYRKYLAGSDADVINYYNGLDIYRKRALNYDDDIEVSILDLVQARVTLASKNINQ